MIKICKNCNKEFEAKRVTADFCSANCRVKFNYKKDKPPKIAKKAIKKVTPVIKDLTPNNNTVKTDFEKKIQEPGAKQKENNPPPISENRFLSELRKKKLGW